MRIEITEIENKGVHDVFLNGELICHRTRTPMCSAARVLLRRGYGPDVLMEKVRKGSDQVDMTATIGTMAKLTVKDSGTQPTHFAKFTDFGKETEDAHQKAPQSRPGAPPIELERGELPDIGV